MSGGDLLSIQPSELKFPFELNKQSSCSLQLGNKTDQYVAFKVKTTNPKKYCVRPNTGIVLPGSTCDVTVTMQAQKETPPDMQCKDKFLLQSVAAPHGTSAKDITPEMFNKEPGKVVGEFKLRVIYVPANPPSPVPEGSDEGSSPRASVLENGNQNNVLFDAVTGSGLEANHTRFMEEPKSKSLEKKADDLGLPLRVGFKLYTQEKVLGFIEFISYDLYGHEGHEGHNWALPMISKLTEEKTSAMQQNQKLRQELEFLRKEISKSRSGGFSFLFVVLVGLLGVLAGYLVKKT